MTVFLLVVAFVWWSSLPHDEDVVVPDPATVPLPLTAATLLTAYQSDPTLGALRNRSLRVTGTLATTPTSGTNILLRTPDPLLNVGADLIPSDVTRIVDVEPGAELTLLCERAGPGVGAPMLERCSLLAAP